MSRRVLPIALVLGFGLGQAGGCEIIAAVRGFAAAAGELSEHLESDLKAELTDAKIDKIIEVAPKLKAFAETAKHKWEPDPNAADFSKLVSAFGSLSEYMAFFEDNGTRLTEFYVDLVKIGDARSVAQLRKAQAEAEAKLKTERTELEAKAAVATGDEKTQLEEKLRINKTATEELEKVAKQQADARAKRAEGSHSYTLSDAEIARVEARMKDIDAAFDAAGYKKTEGVNLP
jgi:hypothetical protein